MKVSSNYWIQVLIYCIVKTVIYSFRIRSHFVIGGDLLKTVWLVFNYDQS